jgi:hypothetical protein
MSSRGDEKHETMLRRIPPIVRIAERRAGGVRNRRQKLALRTTPAIPRRPSDAEPSKLVKSRSCLKTLSRAAILASPFDDQMLILKFKSASCHNIARRYFRFAFQLIHS